MVMFKNSAPTSQETDYFSVAKIKQLMLFSDTSLFIMRTIRKTQIHSGQNAEFHCVKEEVPTITTGL